MSTQVYVHVCVCLCVCDVPVGQFLNLIVLQAKHGRVEAGLAVDVFAFGLLLWYVAVGACSGGFTCSRTFLSRLSLSLSLSLCVCVCNDELFACNGKLYACNDKLYTCNGELYACMCRCVLERKSNPWEDKPHMRSRFKFYEALLAGERPAFPLKGPREARASASASASATASSSSSASAGAGASTGASTSTSTSVNATGSKQSILVSVAAESSGIGGSNINSSKCMCEKRGAGWQEAKDEGLGGSSDDHEDDASYLWSANLRQLIGECWAHSPRDRPSFDEIVTRLKGC
jgi:hypothetical protein